MSGYPVPPWGGVDADEGPVGLGYTRRPKCSTFEFKARAPTLLVPLHATLVRVGRRGMDESIALSRARAVLVPRNTELRMTPTSTLLEHATLELREAVLQRTLELYHPKLNASHLDEILGELRLVTCTTWMAEIVHRYLFERLVCHRHDNPVTYFLETEIVKELYYLATAGHQPPVATLDDPLVERAIDLIEERLFDAWSVGDLAKRVGASPSTLLRHFRETLGTTPRAFVLGRRLDEALLQLRSGRSVSEAANLVGYESVAAFSSAFRRRFGFPPSDAG